MVYNVFVIVGCCSARDSLDTLIVCPDNSIVNGNDKLHDSAIAWYKSDVVADEGRINEQPFPLGGTK